MHEHMNAIQRACILLLTLPLSLVSLSTLGEPKVEPAPGAAATEIGTTAFVSPTDTPSTNIIFMDSIVMEDVQHTEGNLSDQISIPVLNGTHVVTQNTLIETWTSKDRVWLGLKWEEQTETEAACHTAEEAVHIAGEAARECTKVELREVAKKTAARKGNGKQSETMATANHSIGSKSIEKKSDRDDESLNAFRLTTYCPCYECSRGWGRMTSSGKIAQANHMTVANLAVVPKGMRVVINGTVHVIEDVGSGVAGKHIGVFVEGHSSALDFDVQYAEVYPTD